MADAWGQPTEQAETNGQPWGATDPTAEPTADGEAEQSTDQPAAKPVDKAEDLAKARGAGWTETTAFDYDQFQRTGGNDADWHGASRKYEWKDEYGEVGPEVPELEKILFGGEFQMRKGEHFSHLEMEVTVEGPENLGRINKVGRVSLFSPNRY